MKVLKVSKGVDKAIKELTFIQNFVSDIEFPAIRFRIGFVTNKGEFHMRGLKSADFYVDRVLKASEAMLYALNHYSYHEAMDVLEWIRKRIEEDAVIKLSHRGDVEHDPSFPVRVAPRRKFIYSMPNKPIDPKIPR
ncbi:hypothetical protein ET268_18680 [Salmonella enterica]|nr:hypothetical protein [Salmonella enterica]EAV0018488.1 hypothetical protein [Salmonella enterica]